MSKFLKNLKRNLAVVAGLSLATGYASAASVLGNVDFSGISQEVTTAGAALAVVFVAIAGVRIALGFIRRA